jgi:hypothetical protein
MQPGNGGDHGPGAAAAAAAAADAHRRASQQALRQDFYPMQPRMGVGHASPPPLPAFGGPAAYPAPGVGGRYHPSAGHVGGADADFSGEDGNDVLGDIAVSMVVMPRGGAGPSGATSPALPNSVPGNQSKVGGKLGIPGVDAPASPAWDGA